MKKAQKRFVGSALAAASVLSAVAPVVVSAAEVSVEELVQNALNSKTFYEFNIAYGEVMKLEGKDPVKFNELLGKLGTIAAEVQTPEIKELNLLVDKIAYELSGRAYDEFEAKVNASTTLRAVDKGYYLGELARWGKSHVWTADYTAAVESVGKLWTAIDKTGVDAAKAALAKLSGDNATYLTELLDEVIKAKGYVDVAGISSFKAIGAKKLEVKFNAPVDTAKAVITVKKGTSNQIITETVYSADKTSAVITLANKLVSSEYTISVAGLGEAAVTSTLTAQDEKATDIKILSDIATITSGDTYDVEGFEFGYKVTNQYGEDITKTVDVQGVSGYGALDIDNGTATFELNSSNITLRVGDKISVNLYNVENVISANATLTISDAARISTINVTSLYNEDKETLTEDTDNPEDFMLIIDAKDQYGNAIVDEDKAANDLVVNVSNTRVVSVNGYDSSDNTATFEVVEIDGVDKLVLRLEDGYSRDENGNDVRKLIEGTAVVNLISKTKGTSATFEIKVENGVKVDTIKFFKPEVTMSENKTVKIPFEAYDTNGDLVTKASVLNDMESITFDGDTVRFKTDYLTGKAYLEVTPDREGTVMLNAITSTNKPFSQTYTVKEQAVPDSIVGIESDVATNALVGESFTLNIDDLIIQDQYGDVMTDTEVEEALGGDFEITAEIDRTDIFKFETGNAATKTLDTSDFKIVSVNPKGSSSIEFTLTNTDKDKDVSTFSFNARAVGLSEIKSYTVDDLKPIFDELGADSTVASGTVDSIDDKYDQSFSVYGVLSNGTKVFIPAVATDDSFYYKVRTNKSNITINQVADKTGDGETYLDVTSTFDYGTDANNKGLSSKDYKVYVTINNTGEIIEKAITVSKDSPGVSELKVTNKSKYETADTNKVIQDGTMVDGIEVGAVYQFVAGSSTVTGLNFLTNGSGDNEALLIMVDKYGKESNVNATGQFVTYAPDKNKAITAITFADLEEESGDDLKIVNNGTMAAQLQNVQAGDTFTVKYTVDNSKTIAVKVVIAE